MFDLVSLLVLRLVVRLVLSVSLPGRLPTQCVASSKGVFLSCSYLFSFDMCVYQVDPPNEI